MQRTHRQINTQEAHGCAWYDGIFHVPLAVTWLCLIHETVSAAGPKTSGTWGGGVEHTWRISRAVTS